MKMGSIVLKIKRKFIQNLLNNTFFGKKRPTLCPNISGTKCDRQISFFLQKEGANQMVLRYKIGTQSD